MLTYALSIITADLSDPQLGTLAFAFPFIALAFVWAGGSLLVRS